MFSVRRLLWYLSNLWSVGPCFVFGFYARADPGHCWVLTLLLDPELVVGLELSGYEACWISSVVGY